MDEKEYRTLLYLIDQMIQSSEPRRAEYFRGYRLGIQFHQYGVLEEPMRQHFLLNDSHAGHGDHYVDAYAHGYRDGCRGRKPEGTD